MAKDWTGNSRSAYAMLGARNYALNERETNDYYATEPKALELLLEKETFSNNIWECACGEGHLSKVLERNGYNVLSTDLIDRGYGKGGVDFLKCTEQFDGDIITNPPYKYAKEFVEKALELITNGHRVAMFLKIQFLETVSRRELFERTPPSTIYVSTRRLNCGLNGNFNLGQTAVCYAWFIWEKGNINPPIVKWFN